MGHNRGAIKCDDSNSKSVLISISSLQQGGAETQAILWAINLKNRGLSTHLVSLFPGPLEEVLVKNGVAYTILARKPRFALEKPLVFLRSLWKLNKLLNDLQPQKVVAFLYIETLQVSLLRVFTRKRYSLYLGRRADFGYGDQSFLRRQFLRQGYRKSESVFSNSISNFPAAFEDGVNPSKIRLIENYLRPEIFENSLEKLIPRNEQSEIRFINVASLSPVKNQTLAIDLFKSLEQDKRRPHYVLDIYGEGNIRKELQSQIGRSEAIRLLGHFKNPWKYADDYDIYIQTSHSEGSSNALWEAAASGLPILSTAVGDIEEIRNVAPNSVFIAESKEEFLRMILWITEQLQSIKQIARTNARIIRNLKSPERITDDIQRMLFV
jgi:glycosyltransferase involved in cell wall biosynthesis